MNKFVIALAATLVATGASALDLSVGLVTGVNTNGKDSSPVVGASVATDLSKNLRVEAAYQYDDSRNAHEVMGYVMPQATIPQTSLTPYLLVGAGVDRRNSDTKAQYAYGAGLRVGVTQRLDLDLRYRRVDTVDNDDRRDVYTTGLTLKF